MKIRAVGSRAHAPNHDAAQPQKWRWPGEAEPWRNAGTGAESEPFALLQVGRESGSQEAGRRLGGGWGDVELTSLGLASSEQSSNGGRVWAAGNRSSEVTMA